MLYITGIHALNLPCSLETSGDWHTSALQWSNLHLHESEGSIFGDYGIERCNKVLEHNGVFFIADTLRVLLDMLIEEQFGLAQGAKNDFICNDNYTEEFFSKVSVLKHLPYWNKINEFMLKEYELEWYERKI